jgi:predicted DNA-binding ribbon-helix-helix protein
MKSSVIKRSIMIDGHKTSVSLEDAFWRGLKEIARGQQATLSNVVAEIDKSRQHGNLSSAIRLFVLDWYARRRQPDPQCCRHPTAFSNHKSNCLGAGRDCFRLLSHPSRPVRRGRWRRVGVRREVGWTQRRQFQIGATRAAQFIAMIGNN